MKNFFPRFVFVALLSTVAGMVFAGENWKAPIPGGANQVSVKTGTTISQVVGAGGNAINAVGLEGANDVSIQSHSENGQVARPMADTKGATEPVMKAGRGNDPIVGNGETRSRVFKGGNGDFFLSTEIPGAVQTIGGKEFSVGGDVQVPFKVIPDEECKWWDKTCKDNEFSARWNRDTGCVEIPQKVYDAISCREAYSRKIGEFGGDMYCGIKREDIDNTLTHEAVHVAFDKEYLKLDGRDVDVNAQYHFVSEMMAYMIGDGMSPEEAARWAVKSAPDKLKEKIKALSDAFLKGEFRFRDPADILKEKGNASNKIPDLSKLVGLMKQAIEYLRRINAMSNKPGEEYYAGYNKLGAKARAEIKAIENEIARMNLTEAEKVELGNELGKQIREKVMPYCDMITSLQRQIEAKGYGRFQDSNFNFDPKYLK